MLECFWCGTHYERDSSTAPLEYRPTYCSQECYETDTEHMKNYATPKTDEDAKQEDSVATTEVQVGQFRIKVRKEP